MVKLHATRLMRAGEVALWRGGRMVWRGPVGAYLTDVAFDAVSMHVDDRALLAARVSVPVTSEDVLAALAEWWA